MVFPKNCFTLREEININFLSLYGEAAKTAVGFFWKSGWAFILGYVISAIIQSFVPKTRLTKYMGEANIKSVSLSTLFGAASSSCSFAALAAARSLVLKGAHFITAVAFMFASTNLVIELGILIFIFLGWQFIAAEIVGGLVLITISSILIKFTYPKKWLKEARKKVENDAPEEEEEFNWKERIKSKEGWRLVGKHFVGEWMMVWEEILIGFTIAGFVAILVPEELWARIFLINMTDTLPNWLISLENALVGPLVAAMTFIGSMGNIPLATVLYSNGIFFTGIMAFIYSDLMVPPLVAVNAKYYGKKTALYIAGIMYVSIVITALLLNWLFGMFDILPESTRQIAELTQFKIDYTFWMNIVFVAIAGVMIYLNRKYHQNKEKDKKTDDDEMKNNDNKSKLSIKRKIAYLFIIILVGGLISFIIT